MISTIRPFGGLSESEVAFLMTASSKFYVVDKDSNQWEIDKETFDRLSHIHQIKEVRRK